MNAGPRRSPSRHPDLANRTKGILTGGRRKQGHQQTFQLPKVELGKYGDCTQGWLANGVPRFRDES